MGDAIILRPNNVDHRAFALVQHHQDGGAQRDARGDDRQLPCQVGREASVAKLVAVRVDRDERTRVCLRASGERGDPVDGDSVGVDRDHAQTSVHVGKVGHAGVVTVDLHRRREPSTLHQNPESQVQLPVVPTGNCDVAEGIPPTGRGLYEHSDDGAGRRGGNSSDDAIADGGVVDCQNGVVQLAAADLHHIGDEGAGDLSTRGRRRDLVTLLQTDRRESEAAIRFDVYGAKQVDTVTIDCHDHTVDRARDMALDRDVAIGEQLEGD